MYLVSAKVEIFHLLDFILLTPFLEEPMRALIALVFAALAFTPSHADTLAEIAQFAQSICGDIPEGTLS
jgi:hypothetical protein